ncbi:MAG: response regulator, partial [Rhodothermales bacterium]|nr:response regulator [Rhodothermales bacterium]
DRSGRRTKLMRSIGPKWFSAGVWSFHLTSRWKNVTRVQGMACTALFLPSHFFETQWLMVILAVVCATAIAAIFGRASRVRRDSADPSGLDPRTAQLLEEKAELEAALAEAERLRFLAEGKLAAVDDQATHLLRLDQLKSRLFANISHEFRTPLALVVEPIERAAEGAYGALSPEFEHELRVARRNGRRVLRLLKQLLDLAQIDAGHMELHRTHENVVPVLANVIQAFNSEAQRLQIALCLSLSPDELVMSFDCDKLESVMYNLVSNAMKATPAGGKILVTAREADREGRSFLEICVRDTGVGIPEEQLTKIFDRFHQLERPSASAGTGIGLALAKELVELHGGSITVESVPGFGAAFTILLPIESDADENTQAMSGAMQAEEKEPLRAWTELEPNAQDESSSDDHRHPDADVGAPLILVVEDDDDMRDLVCRHLARYRVETAANGIDAIAKARASRPDLIISDLVMPEMEGIALCRILKQNQDLRAIPIILLTGRTSAENRLEGLQVGADDLIPKPFTRRELLTRVENLLETRRVLREQFSREVVLKPRGVVVPSVDAKFLERLRDIVDLHLQDPDFNISTMASEAGVSETQLKRKVRRLLGQAPVEFVRTFRLERAALLLEQRAGNVSEIAFATGFNNLSYFAKCFREHFGRSPSQYLEGTGTRTTS